MTMPDPQVLPALMPVPAAAKILGLSRASAYRYAAAGELPAKRLGGRIFIITAHIRHLLDEPKTTSEHTEGGTSTT